MKILKLPLSEKKFFKGEASLNIYKLIVVTIYKKFNKGEIFIMSKLKSALQSKEAKGDGLTVSKSYAMKQLMIKMKNDIKEALPSHFCIENFQKSAINTYNLDKSLQECEATTFISAMIECAKLGLEPNNILGQAYLVPVCVDGVNKVEFQIGYKGLIELAYRSGKIKSLYANEVFEKDEFHIDYGLDQKLIHKPFLGGDRGEVIGYYAVYQMDNRGASFVFMTRDEILGHSKKYSRSFGCDLWESEFDAMAKKTVIKKLLKYAPLSIELQKSVSIDESVKGVGCIGVI